MSPKTTPIDPSASIQKRSPEGPCVSASALYVEGGAASFETCCDMQEDPRVVGLGRTRRKARVYTPSGVALEGPVPSPFAGTAAPSSDFRRPSLARLKGVPSACRAISRASVSGCSRFGRWPAPLMTSNRLPLMSSAVSSHHCDRGRAVFIADQAQGLNLDRAGVGPQVGALQRPAGGEIALLGRSRQHRPPASQFVGAAGPKVGGEPSLENGVGDRLEAPVFDLRDSRVPGLVGSDLGRRVAEHERGERVRVAGDRVPERSGRRPKGRRWSRDQRRAHPAAPRDRAHSQRCHNGPGLTRRGRGLACRSG